MFPLGLSAAREQNTGQPAVSAVMCCLAAQKACRWMGFEQPETWQFTNWSFVLLREGRTGRVSEGYCYRLVYKDFWTEFIPEKSVPEILVRLLGNIKNFFNVCGHSRDNKK